MPIPIQCPACGTKLQAPDQVAGKKVKCPKCGQVVAVPAAAGAAVAAAASGRPSAPPPARPRQPAAAAGAGAARLPLHSFEELKVPGRLRRSIEKEVGSEQILWLGRPTPASLRSKARIGMWIGLVLTALTGAGVVIGLTQVTGSLGTLLVAGIGGMVLLTMALPLATMPVWVNWLINYRDCYVLTPTRAIVFDNEKILKAKAKPHTAAQLQQRALRVKGDGTGSIIFRSELVDLGTHTTHRTRDQNTPDGGKKKITTVTTHHDRGFKPVGFLDIEEVEQVEATLRQVLKLGPPASKDVE